MHRYVLKNGLQRVPVVEYGNDGLSAIFLQSFAACFLHYRRSCRHRQDYATPLNTPLICINVHASLVAYSQL